jgi:hypothetical protein
MMLLAVLVIVSLMSPLCDCAFTFQPPKGTPGFPCSAASQCQASPFTSTRQCCEEAPNGKYCSECCVDADCPRSGIKFSCFQLGELVPSLKDTHISLCLPSSIRNIIQGWAVSFNDVQWRPWIILEKKSTIPLWHVPKWYEPMIDWFFFLLMDWFLFQLINYIRPNDFTMFCFII